MRSEFGVWGLGFRVSVAGSLFSLGPCFGGSFSNLCLRTPPKNKKLNTKMKNTKGGCYLFFFRGSEAYSRLSLGPCLGGLYGTQEGNHSLQIVVWAMGFGGGSPAM